MTAVRSLVRADLLALAPLLAASFGPEFDLADELEYFPDLVPPGWVAAWGPDHEPLGFLRFYPAGNGVQVAELYAVPGTQQEGVLEALLGGFLREQAFGLDERLRFALAPDDLARHRMIAAHLMVMEAQEYLSYQIAMIPLNHPSGARSKKDGVAEVDEHPALSWMFGNRSNPVSLVREVQANGTPPRAPLSPQDARGASEVLAALKPYAPERLADLYVAGDLTVTRRAGRVVGAAQMQARAVGEREVVTLAVRQEARGTGEGGRLLMALLADLPAGTTRLTLQVGESNLAARRLYARHGFQERPDKRERWLYTRVPKPE